MDAFLGEKSWDILWRARNLSPEPGLETSSYCTWLPESGTHQKKNAFVTLIFHMTHFSTAPPPLMLLLLMRCSLQRYATQSFASQRTVPIITHGSCLPSNCSFAAAKKKKPVPSFTKPCARYWFLYSILQARGWSYCLKCVQYLACKKKKEGTLPKCLYQTLLCGSAIARGWNNWSDTCIIYAACPWV